MVDIFSKTQMAVAKSIEGMNVGLKISDSSKKNVLKQSIADLFIALHNLFTRGKFNVDLNDENLNTVVISVAAGCKQIIQAYDNAKANRKDLALGNKTIIIDELGISVKFEIKNNKLNIYLVESDQIFYFPQTEKLLSVDLQHKSNECLSTMDKVLSSNISPYKQFYECKDYSVGDIKLIHLMQNCKSIMLDYVKSAPDADLDCIDYDEIVNNPSGSWTDKHVTAMMSFYFQQYEVKDLEYLKLVLENIYPSNAIYDLTRLDAGWRIIIGYNDEIKDVDEVKRIHQHFINGIEGAISAIKKQAQRSFLLE